MSEAPIIASRWRTMRLFVTCGRFGCRGLLATIVAAVGLAACTEQVAETVAGRMPDQVAAPVTERITEPVAEAAVEAGPLPTERGGDFVMGDTSSPGGRVYLRACASCHEGGVDRAPQRAMLLLMSPESIHRSLTAGVMQAQAAALSAEEKVAVAEFLAKRGMSGVAEAAGPPRCTNNRFDFDEPLVFSGWGHDPASTHAIPTATAGLTLANLGDLKLKWALAFPGASRARSAPALAGGLLFVGSHGGTVYALDRESGCARWSFDASAEVRTGIVVSPWRAGDAAARPMAFFGDLIGNLYGLDAVTGELRWRARPDDHPNTTLTGTPTLHDGTLYVPVSSLEVVPAADPAYECCNFRGSVVAYDARTGETRWQVFTIAEEPRPQGVNAAGTQNYGPSGAPIWNSPAIDVERSQLLVGTGGELFLARRRRKRRHICLRSRHRRGQLGLSSHRRRCLEHGLRPRRSHELPGRGRPGLRLRRGARWSRGTQTGAPACWPGRNRAMCMPSMPEPGS